MRRGSDGTGDTALWLYTNRKLGAWCLYLALNWAAPAYESVQLTYIWNTVYCKNADLTFLDTATCIHKYSIYRQKNELRRRSQNSQSEVARVSLVLITWLPVMVIFVFCAFAYNEYIYYYYYIMYIIFKPTIFSHFLPQKVKQDYEVQKISFCRGTRL